MPSILDLFKQANSNGEVTMWNGEAQNKGLGGKIMDFVKAEINPKGPRVLFYKKLVTPPLIYGTELPRISLKGTVDPPRSLATKSARYNEDPLKKAPVSLGSLLGGSANRPSDTIFEKKDGPPVTKGTLPASVGDHSAIRYAVEADTDYFISKTPMGPNALSGVLKGDLNQMAGKAVGAGISAAKKAIGKAVTGLVTKKRKKSQKGPKKPDKEGVVGKIYGGGTKSGNGDVTKGHVKNSEYFTYFESTTNPRTNREQYIAGGVYSRAGEKFTDLDTFNKGILNAGKISSDADLSNVADSRVIGAPFIKIKPYGTSHSLLFPATVTGISESITPEWNSFKYVGSPYNTHRYNGVERTLSFEFKLYYLDDITKQTMLTNLNSLKELAFPYNQPSSLKYTNPDNPNELKEVALAFSPNLIELTINGLYNNLFGFITQLEFSIDDATSWAATEWFGDETENRLYPTVINVSFGMTIIENHQLVKGKLTNTMRYDFDGLGIKTTEYIEKEEQDTNVSNAIAALAKFGF